MSIPDSPKALAETESTLVRVVQEPLGAARDNLYRARLQKPARMNRETGNDESIDQVIREFEG
jgi:hypothetical protein